MDSISGSSRHPSQSQILRLFRKSRLRWRSQNLKRWRLRQVGNRYSGQVPWNRSFDTVDRNQTVRRGESKRRWSLTWSNFVTLSNLHFLSPLQSNQERSLSTIMYLMSLLQLAVSPFSVVDEINQGMDQRAERAVHDQMVQVTCRPEASQWVSLIL